MVCDLIPCWSGLSSTINIFGKHFWPNSEGLYLLSQGTNFLPCLITPDYIFSTLPHPFVAPFLSFYCPSPLFHHFAALPHPSSPYPVLTSLLRSPLFPSFPDSFSLNSHKIFVNKKYGKRKRLKKKFD